MPTPGPSVPRGKTLRSKSSTGIWCDRTVMGGIVFLVLFTPLAFGTVHPWAYSIMEAVIFLLVVLWIVKFAQQESDNNKAQTAGSETHGAESTQATGHQATGVRGLRALVGVRKSKPLPLGVLPLALFLGFVVLQLLPLPPGVLRVLSPHTFEYYTHVLPGWPEAIPYAEVDGQKSQVSIPKSEVSDPVSGVRYLTSDIRTLLPETWFPVSLAPDLTKTDLLKFAAYAGLFFLVLLYPFNDWTPKLESPNPRSADLPSVILYQPCASASTDHQAVSLTNPCCAPSATCSSASVLTGTDRFLWAILMAALASGLMVASIGFVQRFSWNGKILWWFTPYDWAQSSHEIVTRASGPFVNANHFAGYLGLLFPLALACLLFHKLVVNKHLQMAAVVFCAFSAVLFFCGILLSLSRMAWLSAALGLVLFLWLALRLRQNGSSGQEEVEATIGSIKGRQSPRQRDFVKWRGLIFVGVVLVFATLSLFFMGPGGREQMDIRLGETVHEDIGFWGRASIWKDTVALIGDFPLFGVGLGAWPEVFPRYRRPPWSADFYREAHNDYLELFAGTGAVGFSLLAYFFLHGSIRILQNFAGASSRWQPIIAAILAAMGAMALHECFDFNLQIPANGLLFTVLFASALRMGGGVRAEQRAGGVEPLTGRRRWSAVIVKLLSVGSLALLLVICALWQDQIPYPYNLREPNSVTQARQILLSHPTQASAHLSLLRLMGAGAPMSLQLSAIRAALWIEPTNPFVRDLNAATLLSMGQRDEGLKEITRSVSGSPYSSTHFYLKSDLLPRLSATEQAAVENGFKQAVVLGYEGAFDNLANYYGTLGRFFDQGALYEHAALSENDAVRKADLLYVAGSAYVKARDNAKAESILRKAVAEFPSDARAYQQLASTIYGPGEELQKAKAIVLEGIKNGAPPIALYLSLAEAAQKANSPDESKRALSLAEDAVETAAKRGEDPYASYVLIADGARKAGDRDQEIAVLRKALELRPYSSELLFRLAHLYLEQQNFDRAALYLHKMTDARPDYADGYFQLALAEEARYRFAAADTAYAHAVALAPENGQYRDRYDEFKQRVAVNLRTNIK